MALVLGIYTRLVSAISHFDAHLLKLVINRRWREAATYVDLRFLISLGLGIACGVVSLATVMHYLLSEQRSYTLAVFMGLILGSCVVVARMIKPLSANDYWRSAALALMAAVFAFWLVGLDRGDQLESLPYFFFCGMVAICAMILPGISGAYILLLLGMYITVTDIIKRALKLDISSREILILLVFSSGCAVGLISFSKLLRWLLANYHMSTMAVLCGFMIGSLRLMWPFQVDKTEHIEELKLKKFENFMPEVWDTRVTVCLVLCIAAFLAVLALERWGSAAMHVEEEPSPANEA